MWRHVGAISRHNWHVTATQINVFGCFTHHTCCTKNKNSLGIIALIKMYVLLFTFSAEDQVLQAGHLQKFSNWVLLRNNGDNKWLSPATFKSTCTLDVQLFPFDKQRCSMMFRSLTSNRFFLDIDTKKIESDHPEEGTNHFNFASCLTIIFFLPSELIFTTPTVSPIPFGVAFHGRIHEFLSGGSQCFPENVK